MDDEDQLPYHKFSHDRQQVSKFSMNFPRHFRLPALLLGLLTAVLLLVNIGLGIYYQSLKDTYLSLDDTKEISAEIIAIKEAYHAAFQTMKKSKEDQQSELNRQKQTQWEFEHQTERSQDYQVQMDKLTKEIGKLRLHLPLIGAGCKYCPAGWILLNSRCLYFPFSDNIGQKSWQKSREYCQLFEGDLAVIDSKDKENATVTYLLNQPGEIQNRNGFWIGLKVSQKDRTWKWLEGPSLVEGYWDTGEPSQDNNIYCASVHPRDNFFKAWRDNNCADSRKWICEKTPMTIL